MKLVFLYGQPGVGKLTVARELARLTGFKLWDNHRSIDAVIPVFPFGTESFGRLRDRIREMVFDEAAATGTDLIFTMGYDHPNDVPYVAFLLQPVEKHGGKALFVHVTCDEVVNEERLVSPERQASSKLSDLEHYRVTKEGKDIFAPLPDRESLHVDTTHVSPVDAALRVIEHYGLPLVKAASQEN
jgi:hypothetical protein